MFDALRLLASIPALGLVLAMTAIIPALNATTGPPEQIFARLDPEYPEPRIEVKAVPTQREWLLYLDVDGFVFSEICRATTSKKPVGHAHIYRGDEKFATTYEPIVSLGRLPAGEHNFRIMLRAEDHRAFVGASGLIERQVKIVVK